MIVATKTSAVGAAAVMWSISVDSRLGAPATSKFCSMSLVPMCSRTVRGRGGAQPAGDVGVDLVDPPARVALVVVVAEAGRPVELGADEVDPVAGGRHPLPQADAVAAGNLDAVGDRVAQRHHPDAAVGLGRRHPALGEDAQRRGHGQRGRGGRESDPSHHALLSSGSISGWCRRCRSRARPRCRWPCRPPSRPGTARTPTPTTVPSALIRHCWLVPPLQVQICTRVPAAVACPGTSRHLLPYTVSCVAGGERPLLVGAAVAVPDVPAGCRRSGWRSARPGTGPSRRRAARRSTRRCRRCPGVMDRLSNWAVTPWPVP